jgi:hypothetical protein
VRQVLAGRTKVVEMDCHKGANRIINRLCPLTQSIEKDELSARNATATAEDVRRAARLVHAAI